MKKDFLVDLFWMRPYTTAAVFRFFACASIYVSFFAVFFGVLMIFFGGWQYEDVGPVIAAGGIYLFFSSFALNILAMVVKALSVYIENNEGKSSDGTSSVRKEDDV